MPVLASNAFSQANCEPGACSEEAVQLADGIVVSMIIPLNWVVVPVTVLPQVSSPSPTGGPKLQLVQVRSSARGRECDPAQSREQALVSLRATPERDGLGRTG